MHGMTESFTIFTTRELTYLRVAVSEAIKENMDEIRALQNKSRFGMFNTEEKIYARNEIKRRRRSIDRYEGLWEKLRDIHADRRDRRKAV
jgi:hypothetical protein